MKSYVKTGIVILLFITVFYLSNIIYNSFFNLNYKYLQDKVLEFAKKQNYVDFKDIIQTDWDKMYILNLRQDININSSIHDIDFSNINLPYRDRDYYQLIIFYKDNKIISYGYLTIDRVILQIDSERDMPILRDSSKFSVSTDNNYTYRLYK